MKTVRFDEPASQQQQLQQRAPNQQQQFAAGSMLPYPETPQQQQVITISQQQQLPPVNGALPPGQQQVFIQPHPYQQGAVLVGQAAPVPKNRRYRLKAARTLAILQLILATLSVILGIIVAVESARGSWLGMTIWSAVFFYLPAGILGIVSTKPVNMQVCLINSCMVMSILSSLLAGGCVIYSSICCASERYYDYAYHYYYMPTNRVAFWSVLAIVSFGEFIVSIVQAAYCCNASCTCCRKSTDTVRVRYAPQIHYLVPQQQNAQGQSQAAYPMQQQQQLQQQMMTQQQQQQIMQQQQQQQIMPQQPQQPIPSYGVHNVTMVQSAPPDEQSAQDKGNSDNATATDEDIGLPKYSNSPPPSYTLENNF